jgi:hypothetical protein
MATWLKALHRVKKREKFKVPWPGVEPTIH